MILSSFLHRSELVEATVRDLEESKCIAIDNDADPAELTALNAGIVASYVCATLL